MLNAMYKLDVGFVERFEKFMFDLFFHFPVAVPSFVDGNWLTNPDCPSIILSFGPHGLLRFAHHADEYGQELTLQSADGGTVYEGSLNHGSMELAKVFKAEESLPWENILSFFSASEDGETVIRETYRKGSPVAITYAHMNEQ